VVEKEETEVASVPVPPSDEPVVEPAESNPAEPAGDAPPVTEGAFPKEPEPTSAEPVVADFITAEVAPEPTEAVTVVLSAEICAFVYG